MAKRCAPNAFRSDDYRAVHLVSRANYAIFIKITLCIIKCQWRFSSIEWLCITNTTVITVDAQALFDVELQNRQLCNTKCPMLNEECRRFETTGMTARRWIEKSVGISSRNIFVGQHISILIDMFWHQSIYAFLILCEITSHMDVVVCSVGFVVQYAFLI